MDPSESDLFNRFMPASAINSTTQSTKSRDTRDGQGTNLADMILEKIAAHEAAQTSQPNVSSMAEPEEPAELPPKVVEVYSKYTQSTLHCY